MIATSTAHRRAIERRHLVAWAVIIATVALRIGWAAWVAHSDPDAVVSGDSPAYIGPAEALIEHGRFTFSPVDDTPMFLRTPGYPVFVGAILWLTDSVWSISPIQAALSALTIVVTVLVGRRLLGLTAGLVAGAIVAVDPLQFALSGTILTESVWSLVLISFAAVGVAVFVPPPDRVHLGAVVALGGILAVATIIRPTTYYFPVLLAVLLLVRFRSLPKRTIATALIAMMLPVVMVVGGWQLRNHRAVDSWELSGSPAVTLYCWHGAEVTARAEGIGIGDAREILECNRGGWNDLASVCPSWWACDVEDPLAHGPSWDEMRSRGVDTLLDHPIESATVYLRGLAHEIAAPGTATVGRFLKVDSSPLLASLLLIWTFALWGSTIVGAVAGLRSRYRWYWGFVVTTIAYVMLISAGANSAARFRAPLVPLLALFAALGIKCSVLAYRRGRTNGGSPDHEFA